MAMGARFAHTNVVSRDWRALADFYVRVLGCEVLAPERHFSGRDLESGTGVSGARIDGVHLRLPGHGEQGPTLEIFTYSPGLDRRQTEVNAPGFAHIAFQVTSVQDARAEVLKAGGRAVGEVVTLQTSDGRHLTWCYTRDPEGNIIELQSWDLEPGT